VASTVLYLSDGDTNTTMVGGATLVTTQTSKGQKLATQGWLCHARQNRLLAFAGNRLHGVLPGVGVPPAPAAATTMACSSARRVTLMVAFWKRIRIQNDEGPGAARPFSRATSESWARPLMKQHSEKGDHIPSLSTNCFLSVPVWEDVDEEANELQDQSLNQLGKQRILPSYDLFFQFYS
jgi:hypothetical protein